MSYLVKELYYTIQGEGVRTGRAAVFCRFAGCNLWSGRERDRPRAVCQFCDTDFVGSDGSGGGVFAAVEDLSVAIADVWQGGSDQQYVVFTGGEPLLQLDAPLICATAAKGFEMAVETNGTIGVPAGLDWITVSPKTGTQLMVTRGNELKVVFPQSGMDPDEFLYLDFDHFLIQPLDGPDAIRHRQIALQYCLAHPRWRLSLQVHKILEIR